MNKLADVFSFIIYFIFVVFVISMITNGAAKVFIGMGLWFIYYKFSDKVGR